MQYTIRRTATAPLFRWEDFSAAETGELTHLVQKDTDFCPKVKFRVLHDDRRIYGIYEVEDQDVQSVHTHFQDSVCKDSCCEFFFMPDVGKGYFNLEMNAGGTYLIYYVKDWTRRGEGYMDYTPLDYTFGKLITVKTDLPSVINPPMPGRVVWHLMFTLPLDAIEPYCGTIGSLNGKIWKGNVYKCADATPHPAWITWAPITELNYHLPPCFQEFHFE